jgi:REP element-mobilizing transposase RayT
MKSKFDPQKHHRRSIRLKGYDYTSPGGYFITIVTYHRECLFGEIVNGEMKLSNYGKIADECWRAVHYHFSTIDLGTYVFMQNHVNVIIIINDGADANASARRDAPWRVPTEQFGKPHSGSIGTIIRQYKSSVTRTIIKRGGESAIWQPNYYEHIIRNEREWNNIHLYIEANPTNWSEDEENPSRIIIEPYITKIE